VRAVSCCSTCEPVPSRQSAASRTGCITVLHALSESNDIQHGESTHNMSSAELDETIAGTTPQTTWSSWTLPPYSVSGDNASTTPMPGDTFGGY